MGKACLLTSVTGIAQIDHMKRAYDMKPKAINSLGRRSGRKGDPRMHRAVQARQVDLNISLFLALKIGGFHYPDDIDAKVVDEENVTLAQRKNQLSRRLRVVKDVETASLKEPSTTSNEKFNSLVERQKRTFQSFLQESEKGSDSLGDDMISVESEYHSDRQTNVAAPILQQQEKVASTVNVAASRQSSGRLTAPPSHAQQQQQQVQVGLPLRQEPQFHSPPQEQQYHSPRQEPPFPRHHHQPLPQASHVASRTIVDPETGVPICSELALRSLNRTAQSLGLTLDQLALVLSSNHKLPELLGHSHSSSQAFSI
jgi:hypothetical protein